jgi:hypothetical protein
MELTLRIHDPSGSFRRDVALQTPDGSTVWQLVDALIELFGWPRETIDGEPLSYAARRLGQQEMLAGDVTVRALGLAHGDALVLGPAGSAT